MLGAMIVHADREFGANELISIGGPGVGAGRNVIKDFVRCAVVIQRRQGNQVVYSINAANPIYPEVRSICLKTFGVADVVTQALLPFRERIVLAFIFGSVARGSDRPDSDVDLMVVGDLQVLSLARPSSARRRLWAGSSICFCIRRPNGKPLEMIGQSRRSC
ncbi:nucleotidyltransferase domain-containing protein [Rhizobium leguminosarum]|uniref:nucleotidyltransferase domain-containing protein n=1 Tax=Rhizobium leguminosarum TaxID=384 RepID=UPI0021BBF2AF|nr:nucleotidyltransferase domain-containing protein [Rhizobium leguminosarum]